MRVSWLMDVIARRLHYRAFSYGGNCSTLEQRSITKSLRGTYVFTWRAITTLTGFPGGGHRIELPETPQLSTRLLLLSLLETNDERILYDYDCTFSEAERGFAPSLYVLGHLHHSTF